MKEILKNIKRTPYQNLAAVIILLFSSFTIASLLFSALFFNAVLKKVELSPQIIIYFRPDTDENTIFNLKKQINQSFKIKYIKYVSQEQALKIYRSMFKNEPILTEMVSAEMLPPSLEIKVKDPQELYKIAEFAKKQKGVDEVDFQKEVVNKLLSITKTLRKFSLAFGTIVLVFTTIILISLISFKISLHKSEIEILKLLGASNWFVYKPFLLENIFIAFLSSVFGFSLFFIILLYLSPFINSFFFQGENLTVKVYSFDLTVWPLNLLVISLTFLLSFFFASFSATVATLLSAKKYVK